MERVEAMDAEVAQYYAEHFASGDNHVLLVEVGLPNGDRHHGIFRCTEKANAWAETFDYGDEDEESYALFSPYVIDVPEFGNIPKSERQ
jgi:hypothetical protein